MIINIKPDLQQLTSSNAALATKCIRGFRYIRKRQTGAHVRSLAYNELKATYKTEAKSKRSLLI